MIRTVLKTGIGSSLLWLRLLWWLLSLLLLKSNLLGVRIFKRLNQQSGFGPRLPYDTIEISNRRLHCDAVGANNNKVQEELCAEVIVVRLNHLLHLICQAVNGHLGKKTGVGMAFSTASLRGCSMFQFCHISKGLAHGGQYQNCCPLLLFSMSKQNVRSHLALSAKAIANRSAVHSRAWEPLSD